MFAIYNIQGRYFRDSLEKLKKIRQTSMVEKADIHADTAQDETFVIQGTGSAEMLEAKKGTDTYRKMLNLNERAPIVHAHQIMSHPVLTLPMDTPLDAAYLFFQKHGFEQVPIISPQHKLVGMLTLKNLLKVMVVEDHQIHSIMDTNLVDIMEQEVISADPVSDIRRVADVLVTYHLTGLPVVNEQDQLVGIITRSDLLQAMTQDPPLSLWS